MVIARPPARSGTAVLTRETVHLPDGSGAQVHVAALPMPDRIRETYLEVRETTSSEAITVVEILSPTDKLPGRGRREYQDKRLETLGTRTHLVEIDLLRAGPPMPAQLQGWPVGAPPPGDYRLVVARGDNRPWADVHTFTVRDSIPVVYLPLERGDAEPLIDLQRLVHAVYDRASHDLRIDYRGPAEPPLQGDDAAWADRLLLERGLR